MNRSVVPLIKFTGLIWDFRLTKCVLLGRGKGHQKWQDPHSNAFLERLPFIYSNNAGKGEIKGREMKWFLK